MPEQTPLSITVTIATRVADGLHALVAKHLSDAPGKKAREDRGKGPRTVINKFTGDVHGTLFQIGSVENVNRYDDR